MALMIAHMTIFMFIMLQLMQLCMMFIFCGRKYDTQGQQSKQEQNQNIFARESPSYMSESLGMHEA